MSASFEPDSTTPAVSPFLTVFPCTRGTQTPQGFHDFTVSNGYIVCRYCGAIAGTVPSRDGGAA